MPGRASGAKPSPAVVFFPRFLLDKQKKSGPPGGNGSYMPHRHFSKEYGLHPKGTSSRYALRASRLAAQASQ